MRHDQAFRGKDPEVIETCGAAAEWWARGAGWPRSRLGTGRREESPEGWRWTERRFSFALAPGPWRRVTLRFHLPEAVFAKTGPLTLTLAAGLGSYRAAEAGMHTLVVTIPAGATPRHIECELDGCLSPSPDDARELGIVVTEVDCE